MYKICYWLAAVNIFGRANKCVTSPTYLQPKKLFLHIHSGVWDSGAWLFAEFAIMLRLTQKYSCGAIRMSALWFDNDIMLIEVLFGFRSGSRDGGRILSLWILIFRKGILLGSR